MTCNILNISTADYGNHLTASRFIVLQILYVISLFLLYIIMYMKLLVWCPSPRSQFLSFPKIPASIICGISQPELFPFRLKGAERSVYL